MEAERAEVPGTVDPQRPVESLDQLFAQVIDCSLGDGEMVMKD